MPASWILILIVVVVTVVPAVIVVVITNDTHVPRFRVLNFSSRALNSFLYLLLNFLLGGLLFGLLSDRLFGGWLLDDGLFGGWLLDRLLIGGFLDDGLFSDLLGLLSGLLSGLVCRLLSKKGSGMVFGEFLHGFAVFVVLVGDGTGHDAHHEDQEAERT